jgi:hypothetical protein
VVRVGGTQGVEIVERPKVQEVDVVAAQHARACPEAQTLEADAALFGVQIAHRETRVELAIVVEHRMADGEGRDEARVGVDGEPVVVAAQLELDVVVVIEARAVGDDVGIARRPALRVGRRDDAAVGAEGELALLDGLLFLLGLGLGLHHRGFGARRRLGRLGRGLGRRLGSLGLGLRWSFRLRHGLGRNERGVGLRLGLRARRDRPPERNRAEHQQVPQPPLHRRRKWQVFVAAATT